jgi:hypothetical protein
MEGLSGHTFTRSQLEAIAGALGDTNDGLTGHEIADMLHAVGMEDPTPNLTKRHRLFNAFITSQNSKQNRSYILAFIRKTMRPERFLKSPERFEPMRCKLNEALAFCKMEVNEGGTLAPAKATAKTLGDARRRAQELRTDLLTRKIHPDVIAFCREELLEQRGFANLVKGVFGMFRNPAHMLPRV